MERLYESMDDEEVEEIVTAVIEYLDEKDLLATEEENDESAEEILNDLGQLASPTMDVDESPVCGATGREFY